jgi:hypothetical protein
MKKFSTLLLVVMMALLTACSNIKTQDIVVEVETDPKANMSGYQTYAWLGSAAFLNDPSKKWQPPELDVAGDIKYLIDRELRKQNINTSADNPDLAVAFFIGVDMDAMELKDDPNTEGNVLENVPQGALVVALVDVETGYVVWLGQAKADLSENASSELVRARLDYAVTQMFSQLK